MESYQVSIIIPSYNSRDTITRIVLNDIEDHRGLLEWDRVSHNRVAALINRHSCLAGYRFDT